MAAGSGYSLSNANIGAHSRPIMVLPSKPVSPAMLLNAKKSNAGVASRILQQRQRSNELKKFSDSLPSLNNLLCPAAAPRKAPYDLNNNHQDLQVAGHIHSSSPPPLNQTRPFHHQRQFLSPNNHQDGGRQANNGGRSAMQQCHGQTTNQTGATQQLLDGSNHNKNYNRATNNNLVTSSKNSEAFYRHHRASNQQEAWLVKKEDGRLIKERQQQQKQQQQQCCLGKQQQKLMKRATSLSSLHNLNQIHNKQTRDMVNHQSNGCNQSGNRHGHQFMIRNQSPPAPSTRPASTNGHCSPLKSFSSSNRQIPPAEGQVLSAPSCGPIAKKASKYKQLSRVAGASSKNNRYKSRQSQPQASAQQQGCPVLPPLPRSQSLHELIQLRATENGQRMRTTGTLRGPLSGNEPANKVNLVAELLESRRQQQQQQEQQSTSLGSTNSERQQQQLANLDSSTMLSQSSSTDDGIHDVSITGDTHSTGDSRRRDQSSAESRLSTGSGRRSVQEQGRLQIFKKQTDVDRSRRFIQQQKPPSKERQFGHLDHQENPKQQHKSTLKRSLSHSALHQTPDLAGHDSDESDDLNELARFLYQFKQRQAANAAAARKAAAGGLRSDRLKVNSSNSSSSKETSSAAIPATSQDQASPNLQQSPNSTTSSSGFASSTCTSNSISSAEVHLGADESSPQLRCGRYRCLQNDGSLGNASPPASASKRAGRKKYPAPARPDEGPSAASQSTKTKCPISGKLKLSSSLLSIVDEYQSTLQSGVERFSPTLGVGSSTKLASVLIGTEPSLDSSAPKVRRKSGGQCQREAADGYRHEGDGSVSDSFRKEQRQHLERLKRYTQQRQMSQSELALNHLTGSGLDGPWRLSSNQQRASSKLHLNCEKRRSNSGSTRPYTSRLINLIRRISDKPEAASGGPSEGAVDAAGGQLQLRHSDRKGFQRGESRSGLVACERTKAINQIEPSVSPSSTASHSNRCGHQQDCPSTKLMLAGQQQQPESSHQAGRLLFSKAHGGGGSRIAAGGLGGAASLSESLCDLNFDCDFELVKNCGSTNELHNGPKAGAVQWARKQTVATCHCELDQLNSAVVNLKEGQTRLAGLVGDGNDGCCRRQQVGDCKRRPAIGRKQVIDSSRGENNSNWRLMPASSLAAAASARPPAEPKGQRHHYCNNNSSSSSGGSNNNGNDDGDKLTSKRLLETAVSAKESARSMEVVGSAVATMGNKLHVAADWTDKANGGGERAAISKLKWSASSWLMNGAASKRSKATAGQVSEPEPKPSKSYLAKLIPSSGSSSARPSSKATEKLPADVTKEKPSYYPADMVDMRSEADQLLVELDQSLDLVGGNQIGAVSWWQSVGPDGPATGCNGGGGGGGAEPPSMAAMGAQSGAFWRNLSLSVDSDDEDDEDDLADYASINRAMIKETFDVSSASVPIDLCCQPMIAPSSPSNSFTFSAPNSPSQSPKGPRKAAAGDDNVGELKLLQSLSGARGGDHVENGAAGGDDRRHHHQLDQRAQAIGGVQSSSVGSGINRSKANKLPRATVGAKFQDGSSEVESCEHLDRGLDSVCCICNGTSRVADSKSDVRTGSDLGRCNVADVRSKPVAGGNCSSASKQLGPEISIGCTFKKVRVNRLVK